ncbi:hypothetical protein DES53_104265 [Roseimicrobium gellanilyticum]|uniref:Cobalt/nickel transport protein n=1 Tax=Roseimicrobium gellanilyticum TaxID=748857 RepID=A0A366HPD4_9BACT|nr:hypothetical protein [Roseimicrobium gellanilyticum]RBP44445.1 hypothetical protein DES53_104265 [Roseimicrobium gellanilyticum]
MNRKNFMRTLLFTCWLPLVCAGLGAVQLADNAAYAHHKSLGWETPVADSAEAQPSMPADEPTIPDASLPARYHLEGAIFGFFSGAIISLLAATVAGSMGPLPKPALKRSRKVMA